MSPLHVATENGASVPPSLLAQPPRPVLSMSSRLRIEASISEAIEYVAFLNPTMAALLRTIPHKAGIGVPAAAWASRTSCFYASDFADFTVKERAGVIIHEYSHVALAHSGRARRVAMSSRFLDRDLFNIAADLKVNTWIAGIATATRGAVALPGFAVTVDSLSESLRESGIDIATTKAAQRHAIPNVAELAERSTETIHAVLRDVRWSDENVEKLFALLAKAGYVGDLVADPNETDEQEAETAREMIRSLGLFAGSDRWNYASGVLAALPKARIDWRRQMRSLILKEQGEDPESTWTRVSRRQPSFAGIRVPGVRREEVGRPVLIYDTSGSVSDEALKGFMAEGQAVANATGRPVTLIEADVGVARVSEIEPGGANVQPMRDAGRGGTDFTEALRRADRLEPSVIVYLTDLCADEPAYRPRAPVIWCAVGNYEPAPGFGRVIRLPMDE